LTLALLSLAGFSQSKPKDAFGIGGTYQLGNSKGYSITSQLYLYNDSSQTQWSFNPSYIYMMGSDANNNYIKKQEEKYLSVTLSHKWDGMKFIAMGEAEQSYMKKIDLRYSFGAGISFNIIRTPKTVFTFSEAVMPQRYNSSTNSKMDLNSVAMSSRIRFDWSGPIKITSVVLVQPSIWSENHVSMGNNFNMNGNIKFEMPLYKNISLALVNVINASTYSAFVNPSVKPVDYSSSLQLTVKNF